MPCAQQVAAVRLCRTILPVPVRRNRLLAPLWVLALGMCPQFSLGGGLDPVSGLTRGGGFVSGWAAGAPTVCCAARARVFAPRCGASTIVILRPSCLAVVSMKP